MKLGFFRLGRSRHPRQLVVHPEVVLDRDGRQRLGLAADLDAFLGFDRLVKPVAPAAPRHLPAGEFVHDDDRAVLAHDVPLVLAKERVRLQQLVDDVDLLRLVGVLGLQLRDLLPLGFEMQILVVLNLPHLFGKIRHHERFRFAGRKFVEPRVGEVNVAALLVHREQQQLVDFVQALVAHVVGFDLFDQLHDRRLIREQLHEPLVLGAAALRRQQQFARFVFLFAALVEKPLGLGNHLAHQARLLAVERAHHRGHLLEGGGGVAADRAGNDQRRPRFVDQDGIDFVDDGVRMAPLDPLLQRVDHVVAQIVEAELVVGAIGDVRMVRGPSFRRARIVEIDAVHGQAQHPVDRPHPFRIALGQVRIHRDQVRAPSSKGVQIERHRGHQRLAFAGRHLGDPPAMQLNSSDQLHVVRDHVPRHAVAGDLDLRSHQAATGFLDDCKRLRQNLFQSLAELFPRARFQLADLQAQGFALRGVGAHPLAASQRFDLLGDFRRPFRNPVPEFRRLRFQGVVRQRGQGGKALVDLRHQRSQPLHFAHMSRTDDFLDDSFDHRVFSASPRRGAGNRLAGSSGPAPEGSDAGDRAFRFE